FFASGEPQFEYATERKGIFAEKKKSLPEVVFQSEGVKQDD
ncbi:hypothetical protein SAMN05421731_1296, partial [Acinetobacter puyangensis]